MKTVTINSKTFEHNGIIYNNSLEGLKKFIRNIVLVTSKSSIIGLKYPAYDHLILNGTDIKLWYSKLIKGFGYWKSQKPGILKEVYSYFPKAVTVQSIEIIPPKYEHHSLGNGDEYLEVVKESEIKIRFTF